MAGTEDLSEIANTINTMTVQQLADIKQQGVIRQVLGSIALAAAAALAILVNPTTALVFSVLVVAAIWLLPSARRQFVGDNFTLRNRAGKIRFAAALNEDGDPVMFLRDRDDRQRVTLGLTPSGSPVLVFTDADEKARLGSLLVGDQPVIALLQADGQIQGLFVGHDDGRIGIELGDRASGHTLISGGGATFTCADNAVNLDANVTASIVACEAGESRVTMDAASDRSGIIANGEKSQAVMSVVRGTPSVVAMSESGSAQLLVGDDGPRVRSKSAVDAYAELQADGEQCGLVLNGRQHQFAAAASLTSPAKLAVRDGQGPWTSIITAPNED